ncbi:MAG: DUF309 domain-containing protein [Chloroflexaceae bacterium]|nr:DUF309 domain-containing protein [Chloroflexaceae bacterium]
MPDGTQQAMKPDAYLEGIRLFNQGAFWHAHEQWEACWYTSTEPDNTFYKGIIQAAGALYHWQKGNLRGLHLNWNKSRAKLARLPERYQGLDLAAFVAGMDQFVDQITHQTGAGQPEDGPSFPRLLLHQGEERAG